MASCESFQPVGKTNGSTAAIAGSRHPHDQVMRYECDALHSYSRLLVRWGHLGFALAVPTVGRAPLQTTVGSGFVCPPSLVRRIGRLPPSCPDRIHGSYGPLRRGHEPNRPAPGWQSTPSLVCPVRPPGVAHHRALPDMAKRPCRRLRAWRPRRHPSKAQSRREPAPQS
jgi:hypothetical protein